jgi:hypothetical protein
MTLAAGGFVNVSNYYTKGQATYLSLAAALSVTQFIEMIVM